jgi:hypothetical protein
MRLPGGRKLKDVGEVALPPADPVRGEEGIEHPAGGANERAAGLFFLFSESLSDNHYIRVHGFSPIQAWLLPQLRMNLN